MARNLRDGTTPPATAAAKTAIAVALLHDPEQGDAPRVVASGRGQTAEQILALAFANGVKVREDADLAQVLAAVELDSVIPLEAYVAVAEILSYVYRANSQAPLVQPVFDRPAEGEQVS